MARVSVSRAAAEDIDRLGRFLHEAHPEHAARTAELIADALHVLEDHPLIGRPTDSGQHELLISRGRSGYIALYSYNQAIDLVIVHHIRHQREAGYEE